LLEPRFFGINLRTLDARTNGKVINYVVELVQELMSKGFDRVLFIPFGFGSFEGRFFDNDLIIARVLKKYVPNLVIIDEELSPKTVLCLFNYLDHVIAMRHHAVIFALLTNKPVTALVYDTKTLELLEAIDKGNVNLVLVSDLG